MTPRPILHANVVAQAVAIVAPAPEPTAHGAIALDGTVTWQGTIVGREAMVTAHPHYYVREHRDGTTETIPVTDPDHWQRLLLEDVQADIDAAAEARKRRAADAAEARARWEAKAREEEAATVRFITDLTAIGDRLAAHDGGLTKALLEHHAPETYGGGETYCKGCDLGCSCESARWPCSTVTLIAERNDLPALDYWQARLPKDTP